MCRILGKLCTLGLKREYYWHLAYSATTRTGAFGRRLFNITRFFENKDSQVFCKRANNIHKFEGCFLRGQVSSNASKVFNGCIVEPSEF